MSVKAQIAVQIYKALEVHGAGPELLAIVGSYGDTLEDDEVLSLLQDWNKGNKAIREVLATREGPLQ